MGNRNNHQEFEQMQVAVFDQVSPAQEWNELASKICKRNEENKLNNQEVLDEIDESEDEDYDEEDNTENSVEGADNEDAELISDKKEKTSKKPISSTKAPKEKSTAKPKITTSAPPTIVDSNNENDESEADDDYNYDDEDEDREDESITGDKQDAKTILADGINVIQDVDNRIFGELFIATVDDLLAKFILSSGGNDDKPEQKNKNILLDGIKVIKEFDRRIFGKISFVQLNQRYLQFLHF